MNETHQQKLQAAQQALEQAIPRAQADPARPRFHFTAPANWLNDPNGTIYHSNTYHLFYQHHPFSDNWGPMYWGHARSTNLINWEHQPIALAPTGDGYENGVWSGCVAINGQGQPVAIYTASTHPDGKDKNGFSQNAALGSPDLTTWEKYSGNPMMTLKKHGPKFRKDWRDPFIFHEAGRTFMVIGMTGKGTPIYEASDDSLLEWELRGTLCDIDAECPNFFKVADGKWLYLSSPFNNIEYAIGTFDIDQYRFNIEQQDRYDLSEFGHSDYYASNHLYGPDGRSILFGWIRGWDPGRGWNGCMGIPRQVIIDNDGTLRTPPIKEFSYQRRSEISIPSHSVGLHPYQIEFSHENQYEIRGKLQLGNVRSMGIGLRCPTGGQPKSALWLTDDGLHLDGVHIPLSEVELQQPVDVRLYVDHSVAELFVNDGKYCAVRVFKDYDPDEKGIRLFADGGEAVFKDLHLWTIKETN